MIHPIKWLDRAYSGYLKWSILTEVATSGPDEQRQSSVEVQDAAAECETYRPEGTRVWL